MSVGSPEVSMRSWNLKSARRAWGLLLLGFCSCGTPADQAGPPPPPPVPDAPHRVVVLELGSESGPPGIPVSSLKEGLRLFQFTEGTHYRLETVNLGGDLDAAPDRLERAVRDGSDLIVVAHPAILRALASREVGRPLVFGVVGDPSALGVDEAAARRSPGMTGAFNPLSAKGLLTLLKFHLPEAKRAGVAFHGADPLSVADKDALIRESEEAALELVAVDVGGDEASAAIDELFQEPIDAVCLTVVLEGSAKPIIERAARGRVPVFGRAEDQVREGAFAAEAPQVDRIGLEAGRMVYRILSGEAPSSIPFARIDGVEPLVNPKVAKALGIEITPSALRISRTVGEDSSAPAD